MPNSFWVIRRGKPDAARVRAYPCNPQLSQSGHVGPLVSEAATPLRTGLRILAPFTRRERGRILGGRMSQENVELARRTTSGEPPIRARRSFVRAYD